MRLRRGPPPPAARAVPLPCKRRGGFDPDSSSPGFPGEVALADRRVTEGVLLPHPNASARTIRTPGSARTVASTSSSTALSSEHSTTASPPVARRPR